MALIEIDNLSYVYPDGTPALEGVSLKIEDGERVALAGANGAGKSTLLLLLAGCLLPSEGAIRVDGIPVEKKNLPRIRRRLGLVFQNPDDQLFMPRVFDDVAFGPLNLGLSKEGIRRRVDESLGAVNMRRVSERPPHKLSAGEKRSVAIAAVLAMRPLILALDEPSSNLDPLNRRSLIRMLNGFSQSQIIATHDLDLALDVCERTVIMADGAIAADGPTEPLLTDDALLEKCRLERPLSRMGKG